MRRFRRITGAAQHLSPSSVAKYFQVTSGDWLDVASTRTARSPAAIETTPARTSHASDALEAPINDMTVNLRKSVEDFIIALRVLIETGRFLKKEIPTPQAPF
jgi:hypothetical protein